MSTDTEPVLEDEEDDFDASSVAQYLLNLPTPDNGLSMDELEDRTLFVEKIRKGVGPYNAGLALGWTPYKINQLLRDPEFAEILQVCEDSKDETVEYALFRQAGAGNTKAMEMWLHARRPDKWVATKKLAIESNEKVEISVVHSIRDAARALLQDVGPAALQQGGALDRAIEANVVDDD